MKRELVFFLMQEQENIKINHAGGRSHIKTLILGRHSWTVALPVARHYRCYSDSKETRQIHKTNTYQGISTTKTPHIWLNRSLNCKPLMIKSLSLLTCLILFLGICCWLSRANSFVRHPGVERKASKED